MLINMRLVWFGFVFLCILIAIDLRGVDGNVYEFHLDPAFSYSGTYLEGHTLKVFTTKRQVAQCAMECLQTPACKSFLFDSRTCMTKDATHEEFPEDFTGDGGSFTYYTRDAFTIAEVCAYIHVTKIIYCN
jgi:hypothetical protein